MRISILTTGSRGDVQPFIALGKGLAQAGHDVCLATHADFAPLVFGSDITFAPILADARALHDAEDALQMMSAGRNPFAFIRRFARLHAPFINEITERCWKACRDTDVILTSVTAVFQGQAIAERAGKPLCLAYLQPNTPSRYLPNCVFPEMPAWLRRRGWANWLSHLLIGGYFWLCNRSAINEARQTVLGLPWTTAFGAPMRLFKQAPVLYGFSEQVVTRPPDWGPQHHVTGYWFLDTSDHWVPPAELQAFLDDGPPPIMIGFGSMHAADGEDTTQVVLEALKQTGERCILLTGWGGLHDLPRSEQWFAIDSVPHDWLLPRTRAAVHHGGAGTTAACLRAGIPALVVPFMADQFFWGRRVHELGAGPAPIPRTQLTVENLTAGIKELVENAELRRQAELLGKKIRAENGVARAVAAIEELFAAPAVEPAPLPAARLPVPVRLR